jgi:hypothetical protein
MTVSPWYGPPYDHGRMLAATADRERALDVLRAGFAEGRLTQEELEARAGGVQSARTYADLAALTGDLPDAQWFLLCWQPAPWQPVRWQAVPPQRRVPRPPPDPATKVTIVVAVLVLVLVLGLMGAGSPGAGMP